MDDCIIVFLKIFPLILEVAFGLFGFGKDDDARCVSVEAVYDKDAVFGFGVAFFDIFGEAIIGGFFGDAICADSEETVNFVDDQNIAVFINDR